MWWGGVGWCGIRVGWGRVGDDFLRRDVFPREQHADGTPARQRRPVPGAEVVVEDLEANCRPPLAMTANVAEQR